ncbi:MAG TPA: hypothetical protein VNV85_11470, partial [Puia sp.]|nr:hypothetical protein [Puia sp.]
MKTTVNLSLGNSLRRVAFALTAMSIFYACTKNSTSVKTGPQLPAEAIRGTVLNGGNVKGVMLTDSTYTMNGDLTVLPTDTLTI